MDELQLGAVLIKAADTRRQVSLPWAPALLQQCRACFSACTQGGLVHQLLHEALPRDTNCLHGGSRMLHL